jgi:hypothetical protein
MIKGDLLSWLNRTRFAPAKVTGKEVLHVTCFDDARVTR